MKALKNFLLVVLLVVLEFWLCWLLVTYQQEIIIKLSTAMNYLLYFPGETEGKEGAVIKDNLIRFKVTGRTEDILSQVKLPEFLCVSPSVTHTESPMFDRDSTIYIVLHLHKWARQPYSAEGANYWLSGGRITLSISPDTVGIVSRLWYATAKSYDDMLYGFDKKFHISQRLKLKKICRWEFDLNWLNEKQINESRDQRREAAAKSKF